MCSFWKYHAHVHVPFSYMRCSFHLIWMFLTILQSKSSLDGLDDKETQPPLPPKADRYNQLKSQLTSSEGMKHSHSLAVIIKPISPS